MELGWAPEWPGGFRTPKKISVQNGRVMKSTIISSVVLTALLGTNAFPQITHLGLDSIRVNDIRYHENSFYAGTVDSGVYKFNPTDSSWTCLGLKSRAITAVYPYQNETDQFSLMIGVDLHGRPESTLVYSFSDGNFIKDDVGMIYWQYNCILSIEGWVDPFSGNKILASGHGGLYSRSGDEWLEKGRDCWYHYLKYSPKGVFWGSKSNWTCDFGGDVLVKSYDHGENLVMVGVTLDDTLFRGWFFTSFAFHSKDTNIIYLANIFDIVKITDGGNSDPDHAKGNRVLSCDHQLNTVAIDPFDDNHLFAGGEHFQLYETTDAGNSWQMITAVDSGNTITDVEMPKTELLTLYISTSKNGIYKMTFPNSGLRKAMQMRSGWNLVSIPVKPENYSASDLFRSASSPLFEFEGQYQIEDTTQTGAGYWVKYDSSEIEYFVGRENSSDTVEVAAGWNMVGGLSYPVEISGITYEPPDLVLSGFYEYDGSYFVGDTIKPGLGYWVKASQAGKIILNK